MDYKKSPEQFLEDFFKYDNEGKMICNYLSKIDFTINEIKHLINLEMQNRASLPALKKLHSRYSKLRTEHERKLIFELKANWNSSLKMKTREGEDQYKERIVKIAS